MTAVDAAPEKQAYLEADVCSLDCYDVVLARVTERLRARAAAVHGLPAVPARPAPVSPGRRCALPAA